MRVSRTTRASVADVWHQLAQPYSYARWVSGTTQIRHADSSWPAVGARLRHRFGPRPFGVRDQTTVLEAEPLHRLVLAASARPWGVVRAELTLHRCGSGTRVELCEQLVSGLGARFRLPGRVLQRWRNRRSLARLVQLAEARRP